jgi:phosphate transport system substrate-binding protein
MKAKGIIVLLAAAISGIAAQAAIAGSLVINGSTTVLPIAQKVSEAYMQQNPDVKISISGGGSGEGIKALVDGTTDIANSSRFMKDEEVKLAMGKNIYPVPFAIAYDCIVPVIHPTNNMSNITMEQLKSIYMGTVRNWKEIGGADGPIVVISRDTSSGTYEVWEEKVMNKERVFPRALLQASSGAIVQAVSKNKNAIGYIGIGYINKDIKPLSVNGIKGSVETTLSGAYPISRPLYMFTAGWPKGDILNFINFVLNPGKGQKYVSDAGFVPLY